MRNISSLCFDREAILLIADLLYSGESLTKTQEKATCMVFFFSHLKNGNWYSLKFANNTAYLF